MEAFKCEVERTDKYIIEFDEEKCNEQWMSDFREVFFDFYDLMEHAEHIAQMRARFGRGEIEGYGIPLENGKIPWWAKDEKYKEKINRAINIKIIEEDGIYVNVDFVE